jgi:tetratricopeptide (TPR) repeat protein
MSYLLELLGQGLDRDVSSMLARYYFSPQRRPTSELAAECEAHPDWPDVHFQLGLARLRAVQLDEAVAALRQACRHKPDYLPARVALASALLDGSEPGLALEHLQIANQNHPGEPTVLFAIAFCLEKLSRPDEACEYYRDTLLRQPTFVPARERLAAVAVLREDLAEAISQYEALRQLRPEDSAVRTSLAHLYFRAEDYTRSVEEFECAIAMEPENWALVDDEVEALVADGRIREAIDRLHLLLEKQGDFADLHTRLADLYSQTGDDDAAVRHYHRALDLQPNYLEAKVKLGTHSLVHGRWEEAAELFHDATELNDRAMLNYVGLGVAQAADDRLSDAMNSFDLAAAIEPNSTMLLSEMARLQLKASLGDAYVESFAGEGGPPTAPLDLDNDYLLHRQLDRHAEEVRRRPGYADVRFRYGVLLRSEGRLGEACEQFARAVELSPTYVKAIIRLGVTQQELGQVDEAVETFRRALEIEPEYVDLHYRLGLLYTDRREFEKAIEHMEKAAGGAPGNPQIRASLALSLQNMGLLDRAAATWRSLGRMQDPGVNSRK